MANEPSWDDIFNPTPAGGDPAQGKAPQEPASGQPRTQEPVTQPAAQPDDPFAALFGEPEPPALVEPAAPDPLPAASSAPVDPLAALLAEPSATAQTDPRAHTYPPTQAYPAVVPDQPVSRRAARESEARAAGAGGGSSGGGSRGGAGRGGSGRGGYGRPKRKLLWLKITLPIVLVLGAVGGVGAYGWFTYNEQVRALLGIPLPTDYEGTGNGKEVVVSIRSGDIGSDVAVTLHKAGVTMTYDAVYDYLVANPDISFQAGNWRLQEQMSAKSAIAALQDDQNKVTDYLLVTEGTVLPNALVTIAETTGIPLEEVQAAAADVTSFGLPAEATTLEGFLFPAKYELDGTESAHDVLQIMVTEMMSRLDAAGVAPERRWDVVRLASIVQREAGPNVDDFAKIARVFQNRIDQGMNLESDATVAYGTGRLDSVWTDRAEREDPANLYNTYANPGLPVGPIGLPGDDAINAALHPADGPWLYFVPVNLATGETMFSETFEQHEAYVEQLQEWCAASPENDTYCE